MNKFKVGDKVKVKDVELCKAKCIKYSAITDETQIVEAYYSRDDWDSVRFENGDGYFWPVEALELVEGVEVKEEKKYTIQEIFQAIDEWGDIYAPWSKLEIIKVKLERKDNTEYQEYLRLKSKFE